MAKFMPHSDGPFLVTKAFLKKSTYTLELPNDQIILQHSMLLSFTSTSPMMTLPFLLEHWLILGQLLHLWAKKNG